MVDGNALDDGADRRDEAGGLAGVDDAGDDVFKIVPLVELLVVGVQQLLDDVGVVRREGLMYPGPGAGRGDGED